MISLARYSQILAQWLAWLFLVLSSSSLLASAMFRRSMVVSSECDLFSRSWIWCIKFSARPTRTWFSVSRSFNASFIRWRSPSRPRRMSSAFVSRFSASSRLIRSCFFSSSSLASESFSFWVFSWKEQEHPLDENSCVHAWNKCEITTELSWKTATYYNNLVGLNGRNSLHVSKWKYRNSK